MGWTPYHYSQNDPINWQDGNGLLKIAAEGTKIYKEFGKDYVQKNNYVAYSTYTNDIEHLILPYLNESGLMKSIVDNTSLSKDQLTNDFTFNSGPIIYLSNLEFTKGWDRIHFDGKFEIDTDFMAWAGNTDPDYGNSALAWRVWYMNTTIHEYLHDKLGLNHEKINKIFKNIFENGEPSHSEILDKINGGWINFDGTNK